MADALQLLPQTLYVNQTLSCVLLNMDMLLQIAVVDQRGMTVLSITTSLRRRTVKGGCIQSRSKSSVISSRMQQPLTLNG